MLSMMVRLPGQCTEIEFKGTRFLITERPSDLTMPTYLDNLKRFGVPLVVRVCESTYSPHTLLKNGIEVIDLAFADGHGPPQEIVNAWLDLVRTRFTGRPETCIAVHCVAGLGRAPVLVAVALMELGLQYEDAVELIRSKRHGAINRRQLQFLEQYKPKSRLKNKKGGCNIM